MKFNTFSLMSLPAFCSVTKFSVVQSAPAAVLPLEEYRGNDMAPGYHHPALPIQSIASNNNRRSDECQDGECKVRRREASEVEAEGLKKRRANPMKERRYDETEVQE